MHEMQRERIEVDRPRVVRLLAPAQWECVREDLAACIQYPSPECPNCVRAGRPTGELIPLTFGKVPTV